MDDIIKVAGQPLEISGSHQDREARAQTLAGLFVKFVSDHVDLLVQVRQDFLGKPAAEKIMGCSTWGEYCREVLHYSESHIRNLIAGRNPATKIFDGSKNRLLPDSQEELVRRHREEQQWKPISVRLGDIDSNPYKQFIRGGVLSRKRIAQIRWSLKEHHLIHLLSENLNMARKTKEGIIQTLDGHHTIAAAKEVFGPDYKHELWFREEGITNEQMGKWMYHANLWAHDGSVPWTLHEDIDYVVMLRRGYLSGDFPCKHDMPGSATCITEHLSLPTGWPIERVYHLLELSKMGPDILEEVESPYGWSSWWGE